jgi:hypothetical protein
VLLAVGGEGLNQGFGCGSGQIDASGRRLGFHIEDRDGPGDAQGSPAWVRSAPGMTSPLGEKETAVKDNPIP